MVVDELVSILGLEIDSKANANASKFEKMLGGITSVAKQAGAAVLGISAAAIAINSATAQFDNMAKSVGLTTDELKAWGGVLQDTEFTTDHVIDLVEELNNKIGESTGLGEQITPVKEAFQILGLEFDRVSKLSPEEQFLAVTEAAKAMGDSAQAAAAADILMGGEANKVIGILRSQEGSIRDILDAQRQYNFLTEDGIKGAKESSKEFGILRRVVTSLGQDIAGKAGAGIAVATAALTDFIVVNNELISLGIGQLIDGISLGFEMFGDAVNYVWDTVSQLIPELGFLGENLDLVQFIGIGVAGVLGTLAAAAIYAAAPFIAIASAVAGAIAVIDDLYTWLNGGDSVIGGFADAFAERFPNIAAAVGEAAMAIKDFFSDAFDFILSMIDPVLDGLKSIGDFLGGTIMSGLDKLDSWFGDDGPQATFDDNATAAIASDMMGRLNSQVQTQMPAQVMQGATSNNSTTINQTINGAGDARAVGDRVMAGMYGAGYTATTSNYSWNRYGG